MFVGKLFRNITCPKCHVNFGAWWLWKRVTSWCCLKTMVVQNSTFGIIAKSFPVGDPSKKQETCYLTSETLGIHSSVPHVRSKSLPHDTCHPAKPCRYETWGGCSGEWQIRGDSSRDLLHHPRSLEVTFESRITIRKVGHKEWAIGRWVFAGWAQSIGIFPQIRLPTNWLSIKGQKIQPKLSFRSFQPSTGGWWMTYL